MIFKDTVIRELGNEFWLMNHQEKGFASFGCGNKKLSRLLDKFNIKVVGQGTDKFGDYLKVTNI